MVGTSQTQNQNQKFSDIKITVEFKIVGYVGSSINTPIITPTKFKGWLKALAKLAIQKQVKNIPCRVNGVVRCIDYITSDVREDLLLRLHPLNWVFGYPVKNAKFYSSTIKDTTMIRKILTIGPIPRIHVLLTKIPRVQRIQYKQGVRDDANSVAVDNPHDVLLYTFDSPITVEFFIQLLPLDKLIVPEIPGWNISNTSYAEAYKIIVEATKQLIEKIKDNVPSPFAKRTLHKVQIEKFDIEYTLSKTVDLIDPPLAQKDLDEIVKLANSIQVTNQTQRKSVQRYW